MNAWQPGEDFFVRFDDKTGEPKDTIEEMVDRMTEIANEYDFDLSCFGPWSAAGKIIDGERAIMTQFQNGETK